MGFFSSNKGGSTQVLNQDDSHHTKSRWFSSKPKQQPAQPTLPTRPPPPPPPPAYPTLLSKPTSTPIHQSLPSRPSAGLAPSSQPARSKQSLPPSLSHQPSSSNSRRPPSLFSDRGSHYGSNAVASGSGSKGLLSGGEDQSSILSRSRGKSREDTTTETLATRLNELALANADGLLGDDEYRILRQTMFEQVASSTSAPSESTYGRIPNGASPDDHLGERENLRTPTPGNYHPTTSSRPPSTHSTSSSHSKLSALGSLFRKKPSPRNSRHNSSDHPPHSSPSRRESSSGSLFSSTSSANGRSSLLQVPGDRSRTSSTDSRFGNQSSSSIRSGRTTRSALTDHTFSDPQSHRPASILSTTSRASTSAPPSAFHLRTLHSSRGSSSSTNGDAGDTALPGAEATPAEVRLEIASVEAEGRRLIAAFDGLEEAAFREAEGGANESVHGGGGGIVDVSRESTNDWTVLPSPDRPKPLKGALKHPPPSSSTTSPASSSSQGRRTSYLSHPTYPSPPPTLSHKLARSINPSPTTSSSLHSRSTSSATNRGRASVDRSFSSTLGSTGEGEEEEDPEQKALEAMVLDIRRRKRDTEERYERRLAFLKGKLRAAELKERAMR